MTGDDFVKGIRQVVRDAAIKDSIAVLENPPGRRPRQQLLIQSDWYRALGSDQQELVKGVLRDAVDQAIFGFFCVLDGVRAIEEGEIKGDFELRYVKGTSTPLNGRDLPMLHDFYQAQ